MRRLATAAVALAILMWCTPASAATWSAPGDATLSGSLVKGSGAWLELPWEIIWQKQVADVRSVQRLANGDTLVSSGIGFVQILSPAGAVVWEYRPTDRPDFTPWDASMTSAGTILIVSRREGVVFEVDYATKETIWRYGLGVTDTPAPGWVVDPFQASRLENGNTLICDNIGERVIEVRTSDYREGEADDGYTADSIVWTFTAQTGTRPKYAQRLAGGNTLITGASNSVLEVDPSGAVVWQIGSELLSAPVSGIRLENGTTLIAEERSLDSTMGQVLCVNEQGDVLWRYGVMSLLGLDDIGLSAPRRAVLSADGSVLIADQRNARVLELGHSLEGSAESEPIDCGLPGARKQFTSLATDLDVPAGTSSSIEYSIDDGAWCALEGDTLPPDTFGTLIRYRVTMSTARRDSTPRLLGVSVGYDPAPESPAAAGTGTGTGTETGTETGTGTGAGGSAGRSRSTGTSSGTVAGAGGVMSGAGGYTTGGVSVGSTTATGLLTDQRGWAMASVGTSALAGGSGGGSPAPDTRGLLALGTIYAAGMISVPLQRLLGLLLHRPRIS